MKPILKNFSGRGVFEYQIRPEIGSCLVTLSMYIKTPFSENYDFHANACGIYDPEEESSSVGLERALGVAEKKWGLKLIKQELEVA